MVHFTHNSRVNSFTPTSTRAFSISTSMTPGPVAFPTHDLDVAVLTTACRIGRLFNSSRITNPSSLSSLYSSASYPYHLSRISTSTTRIFRLDTPGKMNGKRTRGGHREKIWTGLGRWAGGDQGIDLIVK